MDAAEPEARAATVTVVIANCDAREDLDPWSVLRDAVAITEREGTGGNGAIAFISVQPGISSEAAALGADLEEARDIAAVYDGPADVASGAETTFSDYQISIRAISDTWHDGEVVVQIELRSGLLWVGITDYGEGWVVHSFGNDTSDQIHWPEEGNDLTAAVFGVDDAALDDIEEALAETIWSFGASVRTAGLAAVRRSAIQPPL